MEMLKWDSSHSLAEVGFSPSAERIAASNVDPGSSEAVYLLPEPLTFQSLCHRTGFVDLMR